MKIKEMPLAERPRERLLNFGKEALSNEELLAIIIKTGTKNRSVKELAIEVLKILEETNVEDITIELLSTIKGIGKVKAIQVLAALELSSREFQRKDKAIKLNSSGAVYLYAKNKLFWDKQERFYAIYLNSKAELIAAKLLFIGTLNQSLIHPREIFKHAYLYSASSIVCLHNHPSGNSDPSREDKRISDILFEIGKMQGIKIVDHIIIANNNYFSFAEEKKIFIEGESKLNN